MWYGKGHTLRFEYAIGVEATESFRWASYNHPQGYGCNAQTVPKQLRYYLCAPAGRVFVSADLSQAEARVVAYESVCDDLMQVFADPKRSVHQENAIAFYGHPVEKDSPRYVASKAGVHGIHYREGPYRLSVSIGMPVSVTKKLIEGYHQRRPQIRQWHQRVYDRVRTTGKLTNPFGETITLYEAIACFSLTGKMQDTHWKSAISWVPQSTVPHVLNAGLVQIAALRDNGLDVWFHHQGHDSFLCSVPIGEEQVFFDAVVPVYDSIRLVSPGGVYGIPQEYSLGYTFGDLFAYTGSGMSVAAWGELVSQKLAKKPRSEQILEGAYGHLLHDWRA